MTPCQLAAKWRADAEVFDRYGDEQMAKVCRSHADELEAALRTADDELLDLDAAAREAGYSKDRLRHMVAAGEIPNAGRKHAPRVRRGDLPIKRKPSANGFDASRAASLVLARP